MIVLLDESGDAGVAAKYAADEWFCVAAVVMSDAEELRLESLFQEWHKRFRGGEFHFNQDSNSRRRSVLRAFADIDFRYYAVGCNKRLIRSAGWRKERNLYHEVAGRLIALLPLGPDPVVGRFDSLGSKSADDQYRIFLRKAFRAIMGPDAPLAIRPAESVRTPGVQLADYVCGAVGRSLRAPDGGDHFRDLIRITRGQRSDLAGTKRKRPVRAAVWDRVIRPD